MCMIVFFLHFSHVDLSVRSIEGLDSCYLHSYKKSYNFFQNSCVNMHYFGRYFISHDVDHDFV